MNLVYNRKNFLVQPVSVSFRIQQGVSSFPAFMNDFIVFLSHIHIAFVKNFPWDKKVSQVVEKGCGGYI